MTEAQRPPEHVLTGGNMEPVVRVGDTVRRVAGPWTPAVHVFLAQLAAGGVGEAPHPLGIDDSGREVLTYLPGTILADAPRAVRWSQTMLEQSASLLRRLHDASEGLARAEHAWRSPTHEPIEVVCHNDFAPYNLLVQGDRLTGVIDFDFASPGPRVRDLSYLAYRLVPFAEDALDDSAISSDERIARLHRLIDAYGIAFDASTVLRDAADRLVELAEFTDARAAETGRTDLPEHAAMYRRDAVRLIELGTAQEWHASAQRPPGEQDGQQDHDHAQRNVERGQGSEPGERL
ncbi:phosphotransferase [Agromyces sp. Leaf222]|uniref:phosphotransferase n=1 Tax=Agromyces sp. Leaf222 TaxID=1735688 RepID=UPI0009E76220|nr:phosphotransferase [Agromyces sp. Leaf222]